MSFPKLSHHLQEQLSKIIPSRCYSMEYKPCQVILSTGETIDNVYISDVDSYLKAWGVLPQDDPGKKYVSIDDIKKINESPNRLPATLATKLYQAGESGMGYTIFTILFRDGQRLAFHSGNAVDFIDLPADLRKEDVVDVLPHTGRDSNPKPASKYYWSLFEK